MNKSPETSLNEMVFRHREEVWQWIEDRLDSGQDETEEEER